MSNNITVEDLRMYQAWKAAVRSNDDEIRMIRESSAKPDRNRGGKASVRETPNPTHDKAMRIIELEAKTDRLRAKMQAVEDFTEALDEPLIQAIIRTHYIRGKTWGQTSVILYGYYDKDVCRKTVGRWFKRK